MRSPELFVTDSKGREDHLSRLEAVEEVAALELEDIAEDACNAIERFKSSGAASGLAELHSELVSHVWSQCSSSAEVAAEASHVLGKLRTLVQAEWKRGHYHFTNEDIFDLIGKKQEAGIVTDALFIIERSEKAEEGLTQEFYDSPEADVAYSIDHVVVYRDAAQEASHLRQIDLVQVKTKPDRLSDVDRDRIVRKHRDYLKERRIAIEAFKSAETSEQALADLTTALGESRASAIEEAFLEALTGSDGEEAAEASFSATLRSFRDDVAEHKAFKAAPRALKRAYVEGMSLGDLEGETATAETGPTVRLANVFGQWKAEWLLAIKDKKERVLEPVRAAMVRSVIHYRGGAEEVEVIGSID